MFGGIIMLIGGIMAVRIAYDIFCSYEEKNFSLKKYEKSAIAAGAVLSAGFLLKLLGV